ncbi:(2Fe-2S)-binding protein [Actinokineospora sp. UTMC 2448]|uniref:(2Fe-2S)-binding protein n=1 Tax=Actinokineospora sp. UTMC 2448 TaxID=2268449 RepID=UPI002164BE2B|nr:(2Fe-2S)-binding protein [Actinokineospora sp. UTMC 2448]UVS76657.1 putative Fe-S protein [Actinokineospora sp. UTMC 2448]
MTLDYSIRPAARSGHRTLPESLSVLNGRQDRVEVRYGLPAEPGWVTCGSVLATPDAFGRWRASLARWLRDQYDDAPDQTTAGYVMTWYLGVPAYVGALLFHHERRVPSLRPADLAFRTAYPRPHPGSVAVLSPAFACLPDDPAAGRPDVVVAPDDAALAAILRGRFIAHAKRFVDVYAPQVRLGRRTLWAAATDALDSALWQAGRCGGDAGAGALDAALVLEDGVKPLTSGSTMRTVDGEWTRRRESCCFHYLLERGEGACGTCPRVLPRR